jgi:hypothetical protein
MTQNPVMLSTLIKPREQTALEEDRYKLAAGIRLVITDLHLADSKYGPESVVKINGYDLFTTQKLKYWTTAKEVVRQCKELLAAVPRAPTGELTKEIKVLVSEYKGKGGTGLILKDASELK